MGIFKGKPLAGRGKSMLLKGLLRGSRAAGMFVVSVGTDNNLAFFL